MSLLVDYDSSSSSDEQDLGTKRKNSCTALDKSKVKMPKLPAFFDSQTQKPNTNSDSSKHKGRVRAVPHQEDSWATYVYFKVDITTEIEALSQYLENVELIEEQHISLSRPIYLRKYQLDSFVAAVKNVMKDVRPFKLSFAQLAHLTNDEKTRSFLTLEIGSGYNELMQCMKCVDKVMTQYHKPTFYDPPRFHTSIAWSLKEEVIASLNIPSSAVEHLINDVYHVSKLYIKMGNRLETMDLFAQ